jgi:oligoribonuclease (3'-5' exoribonuclease)
MSKEQLPKFGLAIDWETSGYSVPNYAEKHQGISFGAHIFDIETFESVDSLYLELKFDASKYEWDMGAQGVHGLTREHLAQHGVSQEFAAEELGTMILKYIGTDKIVLLGHRVFFDQAFTDQLMSSIGLELKYDPVKIDTSSIGLTFLHTARSNELFNIMGFEDRKDHNSLEDITMTLESVRIMKSIFMKGLTVAD